MRIVWRLEAQKRLTVVPAAEGGRSASNAARRPRFMPCRCSGKPQPTITSTISELVELGHLVECRANREGDEVVRSDVDERALARPPDRRARGGDDDCFGHTRGGYRRGAGVSRPLDRATGTCSLLLGLARSRIDQRPIAFQPPFSNSISRSAEIGNLSFLDVVEETTSRNDKFPISAERLIEFKNGSWTAIGQARRSAAEQDEEVANRACSPIEGRLMPALVRLGCVASARCPKQSSSPPHARRSGGPARARSSTRGPTTSSRSRFARRWSRCRSSTAPRSST